MRPGLSATRRQSRTPWRAGSGSALGRARAAGADPTAPGTSRVPSPAPSRAPARPRLAAVAAGCGGSGGDDARPRPAGRASRARRREAATDLGFPAFATKNTTRVGGADADRQRRRRGARRLSRRRAATRPKAVTLVDSDDWHGGRRGRRARRRPDRRARSCSPTATSCRRPRATRSTRSRPPGSKEAGDAQVIRVGDVAEPEGLKSHRRRPASDPPSSPRRSTRSSPRGARAARATASSSPAASSPTVRACPPPAGRRSPATPCCSPTRDALPARDATGARAPPAAEDLRPRRRESIVSAKVEQRPRRLGTVKRIEGTADADRQRDRLRALRPTARSAGASSTRATAWCSSTRARPLDAAAAAPLSGSGHVRPDPAAQRRRALLATLVESYLLDIQPGYRQDPVRGVYNHGWIIGDEEAMPIATPVPDRRPPRDRPRRDRQPPRPPRERSRASRPGHGREVTVDDVRQLMGASTPHFALQIRNRIAKLIRAAARGPSRRAIEGEREIARLTEPRLHRRGPRHARTRTASSRSRRSAPTRTTSARRPPATRSRTGQDSGAAGR